MRWLAAIVAVPLAAQYDSNQPLPEHVLFLAKARAAAVQEFSHIPSYVCKLTIERTEKRPKSLAFRPVDSIRLQVAVTETGELYAPESATRFDERPIESFAPSGTISTGDFAAHLRTVFFSSASTFNWSGPEVSDGRRLRRYHFQIPVSLSGYVLRIPPREVTIGYEGLLWFNEASLDLERLEIEGVGIPPDFAIRRIRTRIDFRRTSIAGAQRLLPYESTLRVTHLDGVERQNVGRFSGCRQFTGESTLVFDEAK